MLNSDFRDILSALCEAKVEFMLVGAYAVAAHGLPRATGDIDLWVKCSEQNAERGANRPTPRRIDILTQITGVEYKEAELQTVFIELEGMTIPVIGLTHLLQTSQLLPDHRIRPMSLGSRNSGITRSY